jgi:hypothetical protein
MPSGPRTIALLLLPIGLLAPPARADEESSAPEAAERLRAMPLERRQKLSKNLEAFDILSRDEQSAIRALDRRVAGAPPTDRERYLSVLHRYHLWVESLPEEQRAALRAAKPEDRMELASKIRAKQRKDAANRPEDIWIQVSDLNTVPLIPAAWQLKVWFAMDKEARQNVMRAHDEPAREELLKGYMKEHRLGRELMHISEEFRAEWEAIVKQFNVQIPEPKKTDAKKAVAKKGLAVPGGLQLYRVQGKADQLRRSFEARFLMNHEPAPVLSANLHRFEEAMPHWIRETLDPLPPDAARRRLHILYRLVFPPGEEIPKNQPTLDKDKAAPPPARPAATPPPRGERPATGTNPF